MTRPPTLRTRRFHPATRCGSALLALAMQGSGLLRNAIIHTGVECVAACDLYDGRHDAGPEIVGKPITVTRRYQDLLDDKEIDCIINATPDHWHKQIVVDCCNAGKDVYSEKPMTHEVSEGFEMIAAAQKNNRIVQIGSPARQLHCLCQSQGTDRAGGDRRRSHRGRRRWAATLPTARGQYPPPPDLSPQNLGLGHLAREHPQDSL